MAILGSMAFYIILEYNLYLSGKETNTKKFINIAREIIIGKPHICVAVLISVIFINYFFLNNLALYDANSLINGAAGTQEIKIIGNESLNFSNKTYILVMIYEGCCYFVEKNSSNIDSSIYVIPMNKIEFLNITRNNRDSNSAKIQYFIQTNFQPSINYLYSSLLNASAVNLSQAV